MEMLIALALLAGVVVIYVVAYNKLVSLRNRAEEAWSGITVQLKRRHDLVPNLVSALVRATDHEKGISAAIVRAREVAVSAVQSGDRGKTVAAEAQLNGALRGLLALAESNPQLTATENVNLLQRQLEETEDQISASRRIYNAHVRDLNIAVESVPTNIVASIHGMSRQHPFDVAESKRSDINDGPTV